MTGPEGGAQIGPRLTLGRVFVGSLVLALTACAGDDESAAASIAESTGLDFDFYVSEVEPITTSVLPETRDGIRSPQVRLRTLTSTPSASPRSLQ